RTGLDRNRRRLERQPLLSRVVHSLVDFEHRDTVAVDRDLEPLVSAGHVYGGVAEELAADRSNERPVKPIETVGRKRVNDRDASARSERRALDIAHLVDGGRHTVGRRTRSRAPIADGDSADLTGGSHGAL